MSFTLKCWKPGDYEEQILDHKKPKEKETQAYNEVRQDYLRPQGRREIYIDDLHKIIRGLQGSPKNSLSKDTQNELQFLYLSSWERGKRPQWVRST